MRPSLPRALIGEQWGVSACSDGGGNVDRLRGGARRLAARSVCAVGAFVWWGMPGGKDAERPGASGASEPAGAKPPRGGALVVIHKLSCPQRKISISLNFSFMGDFLVGNQGVGR